MQSTQEEAMDVARSAPPGAPFHAGVVTLIMHKEGIKGFMVLRTRPVLLNNVITTAGNTIL